MPTRIFSIDPALTLTLAYSAYEAYYPTRHNPPAGYVYKDQWTGRNPSVLGGDVEPYGLIFQGNTPATSRDYIFAFKGTDSFWDAWEDLFSLGQTPFTAYQNSSTTNQVRVGAGFFGAYSAAVTPGRRDSMQDQLFNFISTLNPSKLIITGHSLGSALAELFALDLYISLPSPKFTIQHYNFACPRVGGPDFANLYMRFENNKPMENRTVRIVNYWDIIPCVPFKLVLGFEHGSDYFLCSFYKVGSRWYDPNYLLRHGIFNYWQVLKKVVSSNPQVYDGIVAGLDGAPLQSTILSTTKTECDTFLPQEMMDVAIRMGAQAC